MAAGVKRSLVLLAALCLTGCASAPETSEPSRIFAAQEVEGNSFREVVLNNQKQCSWNMCQMFLPVPIIKSKADIDSLSLTELETLNHFFSKKSAESLLIEK